MTLAESKAVELIRVCGFYAMATEVEDDPYLLRKGLHQLTQSGLTSARERPLLATCLAALGGFQESGEDMRDRVRRKVEGRRQYKSAGQR